MKYMNAVILAIGICTDVFVASFSQGLAIRKLTSKKFFGISLLFTVVQGTFTVLAYQMNDRISWIIEWCDHGFAFFLLTIIGAIMLIRSYHDEEMDQKESKIRYVIVLLVSIAVSLDALTILTTDTFHQIIPWIGVGIISIKTFLLTLLGIILGHKLGVKYRYKSEFSGGIVLVILAAKILLFGLFRK